MKKVLADFPNRPIIEIAKHVREIDVMFKVVALNSATTR